MKKTVEPIMFYGAKANIFQNAEVLRNNLTKAEKILWDKLKKSQLGVRFKSQHPIDIFIVDFYCHKYKLVIEVDGGIHERQKEYDLGRTAELEKWGLTVIRFKNEEVINEVDRVIDKIKKYLVERS